MPLTESVEKEQLNLSILSVSDESYSKNVSCVINLISMVGEKIGICKL
jgi:hypothetical protein